MIKVVKTAIWIVVAASLAVMAPGPVANAQDSLERRLAAAHRYAMVADIPNLIGGMARQMAMSFPPGERPSQSTARIIIIFSIIRKVGKVHQIKLNCFPFSSIPQILMNP